MSPVFVAQTMPEPLLESVAQICDMVVWQGPGPVTDEVLVPALAGARGVLSVLTTRLNGSNLSLAPGLEVISQMAVGVDNIDLETCRKRGIRVGHTPDVLTETVADTAFALLAAIVRRLPESAAVVSRGEWGPWDPWALLGGELHGMTLGIVGMGRIGRAVARRALGFDMRIVYAGPSSKDVDVAEHLGLGQLLEESDAVVLTAPLTDSTRKMIDAEALARMRHDAYLVNVARGAIVDTPALLDALKTGGISAAALDVTDPEPLPAGHPLIGLPNCLVVPHIGSASVRARHAMAKLAVDNLVAGLLGGEMPAEYDLTV